MCAAGGLALQVHAGMYRGVSRHLTTIQSDISAAAVKVTISPVGCTFRAYLHLQCLAPQSAHICLLVNTAPRAARCRPSPEHHPRASITTTCICIASGRGLMVYSSMFKGRSCRLCRCSKLDEHCRATRHPIDPHSTSSTKIPTWSPSAA